RAPRADGARPPARGPGALEGRDGEPVLLPRVRPAAGAGRETARSRPLLEERARPARGRGTAPEGLSPICRLVPRGRRPGPARPRPARGRRGRRRASPDRPRRVAAPVELPEDRRVGSELPRDT